MNKLAPCRQDGHNDVISSDYCHIVPCHLGTLGYPWSVECSNPSALNCLLSWYFYCIGHWVHRGTFPLLFVHASMRISKTPYISTMFESSRIDCLCYGTLTMAFSRQHFVDGTSTIVLLVMAMQGQCMLLNRALSDGVCNYCTCEGL